MTEDPFGAHGVLSVRSGDLHYVRLARLEEEGLTRIERLPFSIRVLLESVLRQMNGREITEQDVVALATWKVGAEDRRDVPFLPSRVLMQDFTGVPAVVDLAAMRSAIARVGGDPRQINPKVPVDLVIDHSVQVDFFATPEALRRNAELEFQRNRERYEFLRWGQKAFANFRVVPPATGIIHQVNLEYLAEVVVVRDEGGLPWVYPDTLVGTDSHTTMINGLGVLGWGVGGIEAEAVMLGQPMMMVMPEVVGVRLSGHLPGGTTATDLVLYVTQLLRKHGVVDKFVEFFGPGLEVLSVPDRATIANMAPEYGATVGYFPVDGKTLDYLRLTSREAEQVEIVERYCREQRLFRSPQLPDPEYSEIVDIDLGLIQPSLAGPKRPQDRVPLASVKSSFHTALSAPTRDGGFGLSSEELARRARIGSNGSIAELGHGSVVIAAITSCTNTSNPDVMVAAGLLARKALDRGLKVQPYVKTSLAPGSRVVTEYLTAAGLLEPLARLGFNVVGYGCTTCIGNSGPLPGEVVKAITQSGLVVSAVLSGNRNFEGRINAHVRANYLASPPLVVAYALAGTMNLDLTQEPLGHDPEGHPVFLRDLWPRQDEIREILDLHLHPRIFRERYADVFHGNETWSAIPTGSSELYPWDNSSTYIQEPPFFVDLTPQPGPPQDISRARVLVMVGDSVTTDHISPAGAIAAEGPAGRFLIEHGVQPRDFNSYGSRRGNDRLMTRGTFANIRLKNLLVPGVEGGVTVHFPEKERMPVFDAAMRYKEEGVPLIVLAGKEYGTGSSRDWAAKGTLLLGVRAVIAESFERIHRSNLVGMGVLPLQYLPGQSVESLGLNGEEVFSIHGLQRGLKLSGEVEVSARSPEGKTIRFRARARIDTPAELEYYRNGGILQTVLRQILAKDSFSGDR